MTEQRIFLSPQYFLHLFPLREFIHELVHISDLPHESILHLLDPISTDSSCDESTSWIQVWCLREERLEVSLSLYDPRESRCIISREPHDNFIEFRFCPSLALYLGDVERVDLREWHGEYFGVLHRLVITHFDAESSCRHALHIENITIFAHSFWIIFEFLFPVSHDLGIDFVTMFLGRVLDI